MLDDVRNRWDYFLREHLRLRRRDPVVLRSRAEAPPRFAGAAAEREPQLRAAFALEPLLARTSADNYAENLYYLELLLRAVTLAGDRWQPGNPLEAADIGVSHWFYVTALWSLLRWWRCPAGRDVSLRGWEVDPWALHADLHARADHAAAHIAGTPGVSYVPHGFTATPERYGWVSLLFPFLFAVDHRRWRLPQRLHDPRLLLRAAWSSVAPGGLLVIVNQGDAEHAAQLGLLAELGVTPLATVPFESPFYQYSVPRRLTVALRSR